MTRDEIMQMAREADGHAYTNRHAIDETAFAFSLDRLERFANLVAEKEREACAKLCEDRWQYGTATDCSQAIRARGQK